MRIEVAVYAQKIAAQKALVDPDPGGSTIASRVRISLTSIRIV